MPKRRGRPEKNRARRRKANARKDQGNGDRPGGASQLDGTSELVASEVPPFHIPNPLTFIRDVVLAAGRSIGKTIKLAAVSFLNQLAARVQERGAAKGSNLQNAELIQRLKNTWKQVSAIRDEILDQENPSSADLERSRRFGLACLRLDSKIRELEST